MSQARAVGDVPENRRRILELIRSNPGIHKSEMCRALGLSWGTVSHHTEVLVSLDLIRGTRIGTRVHFATCGDIRNRHMKRALLKPYSAAILTLFPPNQVLGPTRIANRLGLSLKTVRSHLLALVEDGVLDTDGGYHPRFWLKADNGGEDPSDPQALGKVRVNLRLSAPFLEDYGSSQPVGLS